MRKGVCVCVWGYMMDNMGRPWRIYRDVYMYIFIYMENMKICVSGGIWGIFPCISFSTCSLVYSVYLLNILYVSFIYS